MILEVTGSMASNGSSRNSTRGLGSSAMANAVFLRMPWEHEAANVWRPCSRLSACSNWLVRERASWRSTPYTLAGEKQVLFHREVVEEAQVFGQDADAALQFQGIGLDVDAANLHLAGRRRKQAGEHFHGGRFSRAVGPEEGADRSGGDLEGKTVHGGEFPEAARQVAARDHAPIVAGRCSVP